MRKLRSHYLVAELLLLHRISNAPLELSVCSIKILLIVDCIVCLWFNSSHIIGLLCLARLPFIEQDNRSTIFVCIISHNGIAQTRFECRRIWSVNSITKVWKRHYHNCGVQYTLPHSSCENKAYLCYTWKLFNMLEFLFLSLGRIVMLCSWICFSGKSKR